MQKKVVQQQPQVRKVYTTTSTQQQQSAMQMNAVKKINSLLQSGTVSVTGISGQQRVPAKKPPPAPSTSVSITTTTSNNYASRQQRCYICGDHAGIHATVISEASTTTTQTEFVLKLAKMIGATYSVVLSTDDVICRRCITILNQFDKLESESDHLRTTLLGFIHKKNNIPDEDHLGQGGGPTATGSPPAKMVKLTHTSTAGSGGTVAATTSGGLAYSIKTVGHQQQQQNVVMMEGGETATIKVLTSGGMSTDATTDVVEAQLSSMFEKPGSNAPQQIVVSTNNGSVTVNTQGAAVATATAVANVTNRKTSKVYRCLSCDFKTHDLTLFQPHYEQCKQLSSQTPAANTVGANRCKHCKKAFSSLALLKQHHLQEHPSLPLTGVTTGLQSKATVMTAGGGVQEGVVQAGVATVYSCNMCSYRTAEKTQYDDHLRKHIKLKPFKCRVCLMRFETREQASVHAKQHQPDYFKCGICNVTFNKRELLIKHLEVHDNGKKDGKLTTTQQVVVHQQQPAAAAQQQGKELNDSTQKLLTDTINEALRDSIGETIDAKTIQFHTCGSCSLTFLNEKLYTQHLKTHAAGAAGVVTSAPVGAGGASGLAQQQPSASHAVQVFSSNATSTTTTNRKLVGGVEAGAAGLMTAGGGKLVTTANTVTSVGGGGVTGGQSLNAGATVGGNNSISDGDLESIFERMHSDKAVVEGTPGATAEGGTMVITNQDGTTENISFNITIPQQQQPGQDDSFVQQHQQLEAKMEPQPSVGIDMPTLDQGDELQQQQQKDQQQQQQQQQQINMPVSMPSLDDDGDQSQNSQNSNTETVPMELDDMQGANAPYKIILNHESGQYLHLDNHILTDGEGNQILVQGTDSEQIQQLLRGVGIGVVMQGGEGLGEGETIQMISCDGNNQMILVQGDDGQEQLIHPSQLNADGNIVIQQSQEGELMTTDGAHITTEDGLQIPVSVAFTTSGEVDQEGHLTVSMAGADGADHQQIQLHLQQATGEAAEGDEQQQQQHHEAGDDGHHQATAAILTEGGQIILQKAAAPDGSGQHEAADQTMQVENNTGTVAGAGGDENGPAEDDDEEEQHGAATNGGTSTGGNTVTTITSSPNGMTITTTTVTTPGGTSSTTATVSAVGSSSGDTAEDQMFNFDELIQPQIVVKQQQVHN
ncbi:uncharacterized protein LOC131206445 [Anopheles bellator]|uniref:uncharacterized protein LOC131206445 n=1 Tax=Anopheles bellator TaxID=139047 RepID=UPI00264A1BE2|nr:uncharacterized protein LOC131206445 [Anopheles bellator]